VSLTNVSQFLAAILVLNLSMPALAQGGAFALTNANLFDGVENKIAYGITVFVRDGLIERIATGDAAVASDYEVIDAEGNFLMPGLFDVHTHIDSVEAIHAATAVSGFVALGAGIWTIAQRIHGGTDGFVGV